MYIYIYRERGVIVLVVEFTTSHTLDREKGSLGNEIFMNLFRKCCRLEGWMDGWRNGNH